MLGLHDDGGVFAAQEQAGVVDGGDKLHVLLFKGGQRTGADHAGVGQHQVQAAVLLHRPGHHIGHALLVRDVYRDGAGPFPQLPGHRHGQGLVHVGDDHRAPLFIQLLGDALAEALGRAGDNGDLARQPSRSGGPVVDARFGYFLPLCHVYAH